MKRIALVFLLLITTSVFAATPPIAGTYSNMHLMGEDMDDVGGWDIQVTRSGDMYAVTIMCGEGAPLGPVKAFGKLTGSSLILHPMPNSCGDSIQLRFVSRGAFVIAGAPKPEFVPRHKLSGWWNWSKGNK
jgi:hypothetical protein